MTDTNRDTFEFGGDPLPVTLTIRGQSRTYHLNDISKNDADKLFEPLARAGDNKEKALVANRALTNNVVAAVVSREDGSRISTDDAGQMRATLVNKLALKAFAFLNDGDVEAAGEKEVDGEEKEKKD